MFSGSYVALVTPFKNGQVDYAKIEELVEWHVKNGTTGIVPCGTTGESATLSNEEHEKVIAITVKAARQRVKVIAGTGSNSTDEAIAMTQFAENAGCDGALLVSPYYNKPTQNGLFLHFKAVANSVKIPLMLYNIQSRTAVNITPQTVARLAAECSNIVAIKEASGALDQMSQIIALCPNMDLLSGDDALTLPVLSIGGTGVVSVLANIVPRETADLVAAWEKGDVSATQKLHYKLLSLIKVMFIETNPIPIKTAMALAGLCSSELRLPMCEMEGANKLVLKNVLKEYGLLK
ncbi:MAG: 4-hydroxy-tetrahydrodipicolinate synthase [Endomicrobiales bacterium]